MIRKLSPAKVNLHLTVFGKRPDGYHDIATLLQQVSLYDEMDFSLRESGIIIKCPGSPLPEDEGNIAYRAARAFFSYISSNGGVAINIKKRIKWPKSMKQLSSAEGLPAGQGCIALLKAAWYLAGKR